MLSRSTTTQQLVLENTAEGTLFAAFDIIVREKLFITKESYVNTKGSYERYAMVSPRPSNKRKLFGGNKVSLILTLPHVPGSLSRFLVQCAGRGMNLTKVESRPVPGTPNAYMFYVDFTHSFGPDVLERVLKALEAEATSFTLLGAYEAASVGPYEQSS